MDVDPTVPVVKSMLLLDSEGKRIAVKYYAPEWYAARLSFVSSMQIATNRQWLLLACVFHPAAVSQVHSNGAG